MNRSTIALLRLIYACENQSPKTFFLLQHSQGIARHEGFNVVLPFLKLAEMNLTTYYRVMPTRPTRKQSAYQYNYQERKLNYEKRQIFNYVRSIALESLIIVQESQSCHESN